MTLSRRALLRHGCTATLAARAGVTPARVPLADLRRELARHGAIVPKSV